MSRVLIVPMAAMAQTAGILGRAITLAQALESKELQTRERNNYRYVQRT